MLPQNYSYATEGITKVGTRNGAHVHLCGHVGEVVGGVEVMVGYGSGVAVGS